MNTKIVLLKMRLNVWKKRLEFFIFYFETARSFHFVHSLSQDIRKGFWLYGYQTSTEHNKEHNSIQVIFNYKILGESRREKKNSHLYTYYTQKLTVPF